MTTEEKAKAYDEALTTAKRIISENCSEVEKLCLKCVFPELAESEDERVRKEIIEVLQFVPSSMWEQAKTNYERCFAYLEKQKYNRLQPIYDNQESFESALDKAWKSYNDSGARTVDGCEDNYTECAHAKGFREGYLFGLGKYKDLDKMIVVSPEVWDNAISDAYENGKKDEEKQKEQTWMPTEGEMGVLYKLCYISNQITDEDDTELTRLYQDLKREYFNGHSFENMFPLEKQKEQKPDSLIYDKDLDKAAREFYLSGGAASPVDSTGLVPIVRMAEFGATWMKERMEKEQRPCWNPTEEDVALFNKAITTNASLSPQERAKLDILRMKFKHRPVIEQKEQKPAWSEEDEDAINGAIGILLDDNNPSFVFPEHSKLSVGEIVKRLKSLRPSWKPSEEQMSMLLAVVNDPNNAGSESCHLSLESLYNDLKKLK